MLQTLLANLATFAAMLLAIFCIWWFSSLKRWVDLLEYPPHRRTVWWLSFIALALFMYLSIYVLWQRLS